MKSIKVPDLESDEQEAEFWDGVDTVELLEEEKGWFTFEIVPRQDRCERCGTLMQPHLIDVHLANGYITLHRIKLYTCPTCGHSRMAPEVQAFIDELEALIHRSAFGKEAVQA